MAKCSDDFIKVCLGERIICYSCESKPFEEGKGI